MKLRHDFFLARSTPKTFSSPDVRSCEPTGEATPDP